MRYGLRSATPRRDGHAPMAFERRFAPPATNSARYKDRGALPRWSGFTINARPLPPFLTVTGPGVATARSSQRR